jgi:peptidoglycan/LPS O-acetylase OafA/YrhL
MSAPAEHISAGLVEPKSRRARVLGYEEYKSLRYFQPLDGLRAVSVLLVLTWHVNSELWSWMSGFEGVAIFFVISGFLITTLCLREQEKYGSVSLGAFYLRRACRIFPLYFVVLGIYVVMTVGVDWGRHRHAMLASLPYYLTYLNDFSPHLYDTSAPFTLSWSLGVEEKFYLLWPFLAFVLLWKVPRARVVIAMGLVLLPFLGHDRLDRYLHYSQILVGCLLALALDNPRTFAVLRRIAAHPWALLGVFLATHLLQPSHPTLVRPIYAPVVGLLILALVLGSGGWIRALGTRPMVYIGKRAYGIYLVQMLCLAVCIPVVKRLMPNVGFDSSDFPVGPDAWTASLLILLAAVVASIAVADVMHRVVERPFIGVGRRLTQQLTGHRPVAPPRMEEPVDGQGATQQVGPEPASRLEAARPVSTP